MNIDENRPKVGVAVIVKKDDKILMHKRIGAHGANKWSFPGGHLEYLESLEDCAIREVEEEAGIKIKNIKFAAVTNDNNLGEGKHYITIFMIADHDYGEPKLMEPEFSLGWSWHDWNKMPKPLFTPIENLLRQGFKL